MPTENQSTPRSPKTSYSEVPAADVAKWFVDGYKLPAGERLASSDFFYDPAKGVFVFKLITELEGGQ